ncbi:hypothetical protein VNO77_09822 [Canavalia gladiata]|uniref:Uncharacterized protein n=1 Tax=Canavalia gladiata TaxID=3824 RepID=A0AAN9MB52_CANGL
MLRNLETGEAVTNERGVGGGSGSSATVGTTLCYAYSVPLVQCLRIVFYLLLDLCVSGSVDITRRIQGLPRHRKLDAGNKETNFEPMMPLGQGSSPIPEVKFRERGKEIEKDGDRVAHGDFIVEMQTEGFEARVSKRLPDDGGGVLDKLRAF